jgi:hypothetical protein
MLVELANLSNCVINVDFSTEYSTKVQARYFLDGSPKRWALFVAIRLPTQPEYR